MIGHTGIITTPKTNVQALTYIIVINTSRHDMLVRTTAAVKSNMHIRTLVTNRN